MVKAMFRALLLKINHKLIACELTAAIRKESFDACDELSLSPRGRGLVGLVGFVFRPKRFKPKVSVEVA